MRLRLDERGAALPAALMAMAVLAILAAGAATLGMGATKSSAYWPNYASALYVAESGLNEALYRLDDNQQIPRRTYPADSPSFTSAPGLLDDQSSYQVWVQDAGGAYVLVTARGTRAGVSRVVQVRIRTSRSSLFSDPDGDGIIQCKDSPRPANCDMLPVDFTIPDPPPGTGPGGALELKRNQTQTLGPGAYAYADLKLENNARLTVTGPATIYISDEFDIKNGAGLVINGPVTFYVKQRITVENTSGVGIQVNGSADFYVGDTVSFENQALLSGSGTTTFYARNEFSVQNSAQVGSDPALVTVYMSTTTNPEVTLQNSAVFNGGIYAPTAEVTLKNSAQLTGAVVGYSVELKNNATVTYDPNVSGGGDNGTGVVGGTWGEV